MALDMSAVDELVSRARREVDEGRLPAAQVALAHEGELVRSEAFGEATTESRFHLYSAVKPSVALTILELVADGEIDVSAPVASYLPAFGSNGKDRITISQVLLHAGGFAHAPLRVEAWTDRAARLEAYGRWSCTREPGDGFEYHATSGHWVLADVLTEVMGRHHADVVTERVLEPAGIGRMLAIDPADQSDVMDVVSVGDPPDLDALAAELGLDEIPVSEVTNEGLEAFNDPAVRAAGNPGGGGIARAADMALWYQALLHDDGTVLRPAVREDALTVVRQRGIDWLGTPSCRTRAFVLAGDDGRANFRGHGHGASPFTFGHGGAKGQVAAADPATGISYCYLTNGLERDDMISGRRGIAIASRAIACGWA